MREIAARQHIVVPPAGAADLAFVDALRAGPVGLLQRHHTRTREHLVRPTELRLVRHPLRRILALEEVQIVSQLALVKAGRSLARDIPALEEIEDRAGHGAEQRVVVPYHRSVFKPALRVHLAVVHDHDHGKARRGTLVRQLYREEVGQLGGEAPLAPPQDMMREEEIDSGAKERFCWLFAALPAETHGFDHLRLVIPVLHGSRGPVGEFELPPPVLVARAHSRHAVEGLPARIRMWVQIFAPLERL